MADVKPDRVPLAEAEQLASELVDMLADACLRIEVAGSIRRRQPAPSDIDLVCVSRFEDAGADLFGTSYGQVDMLDARCDELRAEGRLLPRLNVNGKESWGQWAKRAIYRGLAVDINSVDATKFGMWLLIRTGPAGFSHALVTPRSQKAAIRRRDGSVKEYRDGLLPPGFTIPRGSGFQLYRHGGRVETREERDVFDALGLPYVEPGDRR